MFISARKNLSCDGPQVSRSERYESNKRLNIHCYFLVICFMTVVPFIDLFITIIR
jgi:hypothetical protein